MEAKKLKLYEKKKPQERHELHKKCKKIRNKHSPELDVE